MHILQPKHSKLPEKRAEELLQELNVSKSQLPKILSSDAALSEDCKVGDVIKIERREKSAISPNSSSSQIKEGDKIHISYRVVV